MATRTEINRRADRYLEGLLADVRDLPELANDWPGMSAGERDAYAYYWASEVLDNDLKAIEDYHERGELSEEQERRYEELKAQLRERLPLIERLNLAVPREITG